LAEDLLLTDDFLRQLMDVGQVDLLVAVPVRESSQMIGNTVEVIEDGLRANFSRERIVIITVWDGPADVALPTPANLAPENAAKAPRPASLRTICRISTRSSGNPSPGSSMRTILAAADLLQARACAIISPQTPNVEPLWIKNLVRPVYEDGFDLVSPIYCRPKFEGLLARNVLYPMIRAVFGQGIRELYPTELSFSGKFATECVNQDVWHEESVKKAPLVWMAISAIVSQSKCCQTFLGEKDYAPTVSGADVVSIVSDTVGTLFWSIDANEEFWKKNPIPVAIIERGLPCPAPSAGAAIDRTRIFELFTKGVAELSPILKSILSAETLTEIESVANLDKEQTRIGNRLWATILYEFAASYHHEVMNRAHLLQSLVPLYRGRIYSFLADHENSSEQQVEADTEDLCLEFERQKPYLIEKWNQR
jgi:glucosylglycerate synthase